MRLLWDAEILDVLDFQVWYFTGVLLNGGIEFLDGSFLSEIALEG